MRWTACQNITWIKATHDGIRALVDGYKAIFCKSDRLAREVVLDQAPIRLVARWVSSVAHALDVGCWRCLVGSDDVSGLSNES